MENNKKRFEFHEWDRNGATYMWDIVKLNGEVIYGYSKAKGQAEPFKGDKQRLLQSILNRLIVNNSYLKKIQEMTFYRCVSNDNKENIELFTLRPNKYLLSAFILAQGKTPERDWLTSMLDEFYNPPSQVYGVSNKADLSQIFSKGNPEQTTLAKYTKPSADFETLYEQSKTRIFKTSKQYEQYLDTLPEYLTPVQKKDILLNIITNPKNQHWQ